MLDVRVRRFDELTERGGIDVTVRPKLHVAAPLAGAFEQAGRVLEQCAKEETRVDRIADGKRRISAAGERLPCGRLSIIILDRGIIAPFQIVPIVAVPSQ